MHWVLKHWIGIMSEKLFIDIEIESADSGYDLLLVNDFSSLRDNLKEYYFKLKQLQEEFDQDLTSLRFRTNFCHVIKNYDIEEVIGETFYDEIVENDYTLFFSNEDFDDHEELTYCRAELFSITVNSSGFFVSFYRKHHPELVNSKMVSWRALNF